MRTLLTPGAFRRQVSTEGRQTCSVLALDDDDDGDSNTGATSGVDCNDGTNSRYTSMSRDRDRSRGDLTKNWTRDGGDRTRDWSGRHTNDRSLNDTR